MKNILLIFVLLLLVDCSNNNELESNESILKGNGKTYIGDKAGVLLGFNILGKGY